MELIKKSSMYKSMYFYCFLCTIKFARKEGPGKSVQYAGHHTGKAQKEADGMSEDGIRTDGKSDGEI